MAEHRETPSDWSPIGPDELGARLRARRRELGMSQRAAAAEIGVSHSTLSRVEGGDHLPERDILFTLVDWLGLGRARSAAVEPHPPGAATMEAIELHLRADKELSTADAETIAQMVRLAYERLRGGGR
jgi:transcriptional regulator with XRE-family HTH domain